MKCIKKWKQRRRIIRRTMELLPKYDRETGCRLIWDFTFGHYRKEYYDIQTGKLIREDFVPKVSIRLIPRFEGQAFKYYDLNWAKKEVVEKRTGCKVSLRS